jgi:hypothetical protein
MGVNGSTREGIGGGVSEHPGESDAGGDQKAIDACELA